MLVRDKGSWAGFLQGGSTADPPITAFWWALLPPCLQPWSTDQAPDSFQKCCNPPPKPFPLGQM